MADFPTTAMLIGMVQEFDVDDSNIAAEWFPAAQSLNNYYEFDLVSSSRTKTDYRLPDGEAGTIAVRPKERKTVKLPTVREKKTLRESTLRWMDASGKKAPAKAAEEVAAELLDLDGIIERTHEYARWKLLMTGAITLTGDVTDTYDFGLVNEADAADPWDVIVDSDPIGNLIAWKLMVEQASGRKVTDLYLGSLAQKYIFESTKALTLLGETTKDEYARTGTVKMLNEMRVHTFDSGYRTDGGTHKYYLSDDGVAANMCLMKCEGAVGVTAEGPPVDADAPDDMIGKFAKSWVTKDPSARWILECQTALPGITRINNYGAFTLWD